MTGTRGPLGGPEEDLVLAHRGTAYFLRWLAQLPERAYDEPGHPDALAERRTTIATVGYDARGWAHLVEAVREERRGVGAFAMSERHAAILAGASLPAHALRHLVEHSAVQLAVEWRDLPVEAWGDEGVDVEGAVLPVSRTPWLRARQTWLGAFDLGTGGTFADFPSAVIDRLITERGGTILHRGDDHQVEWHGSRLSGTPASIARRILRPAAARRPRVLASA